MNRPKGRKALYLSCAIATWMALPGMFVNAYGADVGTTREVIVTASAAEEEAKTNSQQVSIVTKEDIEQIQAKTVEDIIFTETGVSRTVDSMGRVGVSIRGAEPRHTLILVDGQAVLGDLAKFSGAADEVMRLGTENVERIEVIQGAASAKYGADAIGGVINIITKKAGKKPGLQVNAEGLKSKGSHGAIPYQNFFVRADSGDLGKLRVAISGSQRDVMPVYASEKRAHSGFSFEYDNREFKPNALRYYGDASDIGLAGTYEIDKNNEVEFRVNRYAEDLVRDVKHTDSDLEPQQHFKRNSNRNTFNLIWNGRAGDTDWKVEGNYSAIKEDDVALINYKGRSAYEGKNELRYIDNVDHRQKDFKASLNTAIGDKHLLTYGGGITHETGKGSRLKSSPHVYTTHIDPWDYDKSLLVEGLDRMSRREGDNSVRVWSHIHDYAFKPGVSGMPQWDQDLEYYGAKDPSEVPGITYGDYVRYDLKKSEASRWYNNFASQGMSNETYEKYNAFRKQLEQENPDFKGSNIVGKYFEYGESTDPTKYENAPVYNGRKFLEEYRERDQRITVGEGSIKKKHFFLQDTWQLNKDTLLLPSLRYDHSSLFGGHLSYNMGVTHNLGGKANRRLKANIGTGYSEPGMGELWYNWEMFASNPVGIGVARLGWYWAGNPNLQPEKSRNFDISLEGENKNTYGRVGLFHNRIRNYMSVYFTGDLIDFAPYLSADQKFQRAPDMIYSFKNIGKAEITGLQAEVRQKFGKHWSGRLGYTWLHALNKSDPTMPDKLLDKPTHKIDVGISYENKKSGWSGQLWGEYYLDMLDSNTLKNRANYWPDIQNNIGDVFHKQEYDKKSFSVWNLMVQKKFNEDSMAYFGINNIFNHRDDDRATQARVYRVGVNLKFGPSGMSDVKAAKGEGRTAVVKGALKGTSVATETGAMKESKASEALDGFIDAPFDTSKEKGYEVVGDYRARLESHGGTNRPQSPYRSGFSIGSGQYNMYDEKEHGMSQRVRVGVDARVGENTNVKVVGSASGYDTVDTASTVSPSKGFNHQRLEELDVTQHVNRWDLSVGRIHETMGATGYWFDKEYDGGRAVWTGDDSQVRLGYGSFKRSTGISDSPYTHTVNQAFFRAPTVEELIGINRELYPYDLDRATMVGPDDQVKRDDMGKVIAAEGSPNAIYESTYKGKEDGIYFYQQLRDVYEAGKEAGKTDLEIAADQSKIIKRLQGILDSAYHDELSKVSFALNIPNKSKVIYELVDKDGNVKQKRASINFSTYISPYDSPEEKAFKEDMIKRFAITLDDASALDGASYIDSKKDVILKAYEEIATRSAKEEWKNYANTDADEPGSFGDEWVVNGDEGRTVRSDAKSEDYTFKGVVGLITTERSWGATRFTNTDILKEVYEANYGKANSTRARYGMSMTPVNFNFLNELEYLVRKTESGNKLPREAFEKTIGKPILVEGMVLQKDEVPSIDKAFFIQGKHQLNDRVGLQAWMLRSVGDKQHTFMTANGTGNDVSTLGNVANVWGVGAQWKLGAGATLSVDYGQNRSDVGRYLNGRSVYEHQRGTADFTLHGRTMGKVPHFWVARLDIGKSDFAVPGSWNAYVDYKYFQHGSFFGGNGTDAVPDRYLDGVRSFTLGAGYVPKKDLLIEAFYTFDAKGVAPRDTLYGPERFKLGNYARIQGTYKF